MRTSPNCVGGRKYSGKQSIDGDKNPNGRCSNLVNWPKVRVTSMIVFHNQIETERLHNFLRNLGKLCAASVEKTATNIMEIVEEL